MRIIIKTVQHCNECPYKRPDISANNMSWECNYWNGPRGEPTLLENEGGRGIPEDCELEKVVPRNKEGSW